jgi:hypothetical protein
VVPENTFAQFLEEIMGIYEEIMGKELGVL